jgi:hypothetical protein
MESQPLGLAHVVVRRFVLSTPHGVSGRLWGRLANRIVSIAQSTKPDSACRPTEHEIPNGVPHGPDPCVLQLEALAEPLRNGGRIVRSC